MRNLLAVGLLIVGMSSILNAGLNVTAPEVDATSAMSAIALLAGAAVVIRGRRKN
jgi:hypothetical protein